jgi:hypothetical protein
MCLGDQLVVCVTVFVPVSSIKILTHFTKPDKYIMKLDAIPTAYYLISNN